jgi:hypothetical protein
MMPTDLTFVGDGRYDAVVPSSDMHRRTNHGQLGPFLLDGADAD